MLAESLKIKTLDGRSDWTRTSGLLVPNQAHYQAVPHPGFTVLAYYTTNRAVCQSLFRKKVETFEKIRLGAEGRLALVGFAHWLGSLAVGAPVFSGESGWGIVHALLFLRFLLTIFSKCVILNLQHVLY